MTRYKLLLISGIYLLLILVGVIQFSLWDQVQGYYNLGLAYNLMAMWGHPHFLRFLLVVPVYRIADFLELAPNFVFSITCSALVFGIANVLTQAFGIISKQTLPVLTLGSTVILSLFMNGRILYSMFAVSLLLFLTICWYEEKEQSKMRLLLFVGFSLLFSGVSSGTFLVIYCALISWFCYIIFVSLYKKKVKKNDLSVLIILCFYLIVSWSLVRTFVIKNIKFYNDVWSMLHHGVGKVLLFLPLETLVVVGLIVVTLLLFTSFLLSRIEVVGIVVVMIVIALSCGVFGYSTLAMVFPPALLLAEVFLVNYLSTLKE